MDTCRFSLFALIWLLAHSAVLSQVASPEGSFQVSKDRISHRIEALSKFGHDSIGRNYRVAYSQGDLEGRAYFMGLMKAAGLEVSVDYAGNIIGKRAGKFPSGKYITFGSHIDMVPNGGNYDGCVGSIGALEVIEVLQEHHYLTNHPLEVIIFSNEEGGEIGSHGFHRNLSGASLKEKSNSGLLIADGIRRVGGNPDSLERIHNPAGELAAYLELHIEQGGILEKEKRDIGVVEGIVGIEEWECTVEGMANHAGTTPMNQRQDALLAAARLIISVHEAVNSYQGRQVGNIGRITALPGAPNVVPGRVIMSLELRDLSKAKIDSMFQNIETRAAAIAGSSGTRISFRNLNLGSTPELMNPDIQQAIMASATRLGLSYKVMPSGAGHDAQEMAQVVPSGMIFIPSQGGISHSPREYSTPGDMANGAGVLLQTILALDKK